MSEKLKSVQYTAKKGHPLPDWRNLGVILRIVLGVNLLSLAAALAGAFSFQHWIERFVENAAWVETLLLINLPILALARDILWRCPPRVAQSIALLFAAAAAILLQDAFRFFALTENFFIWRPCLLAIFASACVLFYFELRAEALSPRLEEARLSVLNARIRPHFFFNSLNTVLALIRNNPQSAETTLENLSELFRALLKTPSALVPLSEEIALGRRYLEVEKLRLCERLRIVWEIEALPQDMLVPPLILQPLLENAVYHGIESLDEGGEIYAKISAAGDFFQIEIDNSVGSGSQRVTGNHMALDNIRQRLALYYDIEARLEQREKDGRYHVRVILPRRTENISLL